MANDGIPVEVLEARLEGLKGWLGERFDRLDERANAQSARIEKLQGHVNSIANEIDEFKLQLGEKFERLNERLGNQCEAQEKIEEKVENHEVRLVKLERYPWLLRLLAMLAVPVVTWGLVELVKAIGRAILGG